MRTLVFFVALVAGLAPLEAQQSTKQAPGKQAAPAAAAKPAVAAPPETILFESPRGNVTYTHKKHYERVNGNCAACHPSVFPMAKADLNYKKANHRAAEANHTSCAFCHAVGGSKVSGTAFAADSYCTKCHVIDHSKH